MYTYVTETDPKYAKTVYGLAAIAAAVGFSVLGLIALTVSFITWLVAVKKRVMFSKVKLKSLSVKA